MTLSLVIGHYISLGHKIYSDFMIYLTRDLHRIRVENSKTTNLVKPAMCDHLVLWVVVACEPKIKGSYPIAVKNESTNSPLVFLSCSIMWWPIFNNMTSILPNPDLYVSQFNIPLRIWALSNYGLKFLFIYKLSQIFPLNQAGIEP